MLSLPPNQVLIALLIQVLSVLLNQVLIASLIQVLSVSLNQVLIAPLVQVLSVPLNQVLIAFFIQVFSTLPNQAAQSGAQRFRCATRSLNQVTRNISPSFTSLTTPIMSGPASLAAYFVAIYSLSSPSIPIQAGYLAIQARRQLYLASI